VDKASLEKRLQELGIYQDFFYRKELKSLCQLLHPGEVLNCILTGVNEANRKMVVITDERILIIFAAALGSGEIQVIKRSAVTDYYFDKKLLRSAAYIATPENEFLFTGVQGNLKELFDWAMTRPIPDLRGTENTAG